jgi:sugar porter (SP) family MFS transporter
MNGFQAMPGFLQVFGYPDPALAAGYGIEVQFQQLITSLLNVGLIVCSICLGPISHFLGRRHLFWLGGVFLTIGLLLQIFCTSYGLIYLARLLLGIGNGFYVNGTILYIAEASPSHLCGIFVSTYQLNQNIGGLAGAIVNNFTAKIHSRLCYQIPSATLFAVPLFLSIFVFFIPESPRWLSYRNRHEEAEKALRRLRGKKMSEEIIQQEIFEIRETIRLEKELTSHSSLRDLVRGSDLRRTLLAIGAACAHQASGILFLVGYGTYFLQISGIPQPFLYTVGIQAVSVGGAILGVVAQKFFGRRPILISGTTITTISMFTVAIIWTAAGSSHTQAQGRAIVAMINVFTAAYSYSIGPVGWLVAGEIPSNRLRSLTFGIAMAFGFFFAWLVSFTTPYFFNPNQLGWGPKIGWIWGPSSLVLLIWIIFFLPETKDRSLEERDTPLLSISDLSRRDVCTEVVSVEIQELQMHWNRKCCGDPRENGRNGTRSR